MPGLANFTAAMLDEGTTTRNALQIADEVARLGASLATGSTMDATQVAVTSLAAQFPADAGARGRRRAQSRRSRPEEVERQRASRLANLVAQKSNPAQIASRVMAAALYGSGASVWLHGARHRGVEQGADARRDGRLLEAATRAGQCRAGRRRGDVAQASSSRWRRRRSRGWTGKATPAQPPAGTARHRRKAGHRRHAGCARRRRCGSPASACRAPRPTSRRSR